MFKKKNFERLESITPDAPGKNQEKLARQADVKIREDRIGKYFKKYTNQFVFDEFSQSYLEKAGKGLPELMSGVPIPLRKEDVKEFAGGSGVHALHLAENMTWIMGIDPHFKYNKKYVAFLNTLYNRKIAEGMLKKGRNAAEQEDYDKACIYFRATLCMNPTYLHGMYSYARVCRAMYLESNDEEYTGRFKAEAMDYFELITEAHPEFSQSYYYLGYAYLNMGLYIKAELAWKAFISKSQTPEDIKEIEERLTQIKEPVEIEQGCNMVFSGSFHQGLDILEPFMETEFKTWWPLSYYLGVCYARLERQEEALARFKNVFTMNASHIETMEELADIYAARNDKENEEKYRRKAELIRQS
jgi:tetratricopeptide (TPR) repeat protein